MKKYADFRHRLGKLASKLEHKYYENGKTGQIQKIYDNFRFSVQILAKIIINFSDFSIFPIFVILIIRLGANFFVLAEISIFFRFYSFFGFIRPTNKLISAISWEFSK